MMQTARRTKIRRPFIALLLSGLLAGAECGEDPNSLAPRPGFPDNWKVAMIPVPGGLLNVQGGNLYIERRDLSIDTRLGRWDVGAVWNSASGAWHWNFDVSFDGTFFRDETDFVYDLGLLQDGDAIPGSHWVKVSSTQIKTRGGRLYEFNATGELASVRWTSADYPRLRYSRQSGGGNTFLLIEQCTAPTTCENVYTIVRSTGGQVEAISDRALRVASFDYASGQLIAARDGKDNDEGHPGFRYGYNSEGRLSSIKNAEDEEILIAYGAEPRPVVIRRAGPPIAQHLFLYSDQQSGHYTTTVTGPAMDETVYRYDNLYRLKSRTNHVGDEWTYLWDGTPVGSRIIKRISPMGVETEWTYQDDDIATMIVPGGANTIVYSYDPNAVDRSHPNQRPIKKIYDSLGLVEAKGFDLQGRLIEHRRPQSESTLFAYNANEELETVTTPFGVTATLSAYGNHGHPTSVTIGSETNNRVYDAVGNLIEADRSSYEVGPGQAVVSRTFDADRNVASLLLEDLPTGGSPVQTPLTIEWRSDHHPLAARRPYGGDTELVYDNFGRPIQRRDRVSGIWQVTQVERAEDGRVTALERPNGMRREFTYDSARRVDSITLKLDGVIENSSTFQYEDGRISSIADTAYGGGIEQRSYGVTGKFTSRVYATGESETLTLDPRGRPTSHQYVDRFGQELRVINRTYDLADRVLTISDGTNTFVSQTYIDGLVAQVVLWQRLDGEYYARRRNGQLREYGRRRFERSVGCHNACGPHRVRSVQLRDE